MSKKARFYAEIEEGKLKFLSPEWVTEKMKEFNNKKISVTVEEFFGQRTNQQNRYYWAIVVHMVYEGLVNMGYDEIRSTEDAHEFLKSLFLKRKVINKNTGELVGEFSGSSTNLQTIDFNKYLEQIWQWSAEWLGITIPEPNTQSKLFPV